MDELGVGTRVWTRQHGAGVVAGRQRSRGGEWLDDPEGNFILVRTRGAHELRVVCAAVSRTLWPLPTPARARELLARLQTAPSPDELPAPGARYLELRRVVDDGSIEERVDALRTLRALRDPIRGELVLREQLAELPQVLAEIAGVDVPARERVDIPPPVWIDAEAVERETGGPAWERAVLASRDARHAAYRSIGRLSDDGLELADPDLDDPLDVLRRLAAAPWPSSPRWMTITRDDRVAIVTDGLSDPWPDGAPNGLGLELLLETHASELRGAAGKALVETWPFQVLAAASLLLASKPDAREALERAGVAVLEVDGSSCPSSARAPSGRVGLLLGLRAKGVPERIELPSGDALVVVATLLTPDELAHVTDGGHRARKAIRKALRASPTRHLSVIDRPSVRASAEVTPSAAEEETGHEEAEGFGEQVCSVTRRTGLMARVLLGLALAALMCFGAAIVSHHAQGSAALSWPVTGACAGLAFALVWLMTRSSGPILVVYERGFEWRGLSLAYSDLSSIEARPDMPGSLVCDRRSGTILVLEGITAQLSRAELASFLALVRRARPTALDPRGPLAALVGAAAVRERR